MNISFCIGNGPSREKFDLDLLTGKGKTYGCNYLIEEFPLDNTVVVDRTLLITMLSKNVHSKTNLYTRAKWKTSVDVEIHYLDAPVRGPTHRWDNETHWGSGTHALNLAAKDGAELIVMLGYDLYAGNIYSSKTVDPSCWMHQISRCFEMHPDVQFVQIQPAGWKIPSSWQSDNFSIDDFDALKSMLGELE